MVYTEHIFAMHTLLVNNTAAVTVFETYTNTPLVHHIYSSAITRSSEFDHIIYTPLVQVGHIKFEHQYPFQCTIQLCNNAVYKEFRI